MRSWTGLAALVVGLLGCQKPAERAAAPDPGVVAEVGDRKITVADVQAEASRRSGARRAAPEKEALVQDLIQRESLLLQAREAGLERDPAVARELENVLIRHLLATELEPRKEAVSVSTNEVQAEYTAHPERYSRPAQSRFALLFRAANPKASAEARSHSRSVLAEARSRFLGSPASPSPAPGVAPGFGPLAAEVSEDQITRYRSGDLGWLSPDQTPARIPAGVMKAGWELPVGKVSEVFEAPDGFYLILKTDTREPGQTSLASVEAVLRQSLLVRKRKEAEEAFHAGIARRFPARIHTGVLETLILPEARSSLTASNRQSQPPVLPGTTPTSHGP